MMDTTRAEEDLEIARGSSPSPGSMPRHAPACPGMPRQSESVAFLITFNTPYMVIFRADGPHRIHSKPHQYPEDIYHTYFKPI